MIEVLKYLKEWMKAPKYQHKRMKTIDTKEEIWIEVNTLFYKDIGGIEKADLRTLKYAYVQVLGGVPYLFVFADHQHYISTELQGFEKVYHDLSHRFSFDDDTFLRVCREKKEDEKVKIWTKKMVQNYQILDEERFDADFGYEVYAEPKRMLSWDTTHDELEASGLVESYFTDFGARYLRFKYPVRIEQIVIQGFELYVENTLSNRPIQEYFINLYDDTNTDRSYQQLRKLWLNEEIDVDEYGYERNDQCYLRFNFAKGIEASICYTYDEYSYDDGSTSLHFYNTRAYDHFLDNEAYEEQMEISAILPLHKKLDINISHLDNGNIKHIPAEVKDLLKGKSGIWIDRLNNKIGFVGTDTALILDVEAIDHFTFQNILPAKGPGYADFMVHLKTGSDLYVYTENTHYFDQFEKELQQLTHKKVRIPEPYYNC
ncbi:hypothetical protein [Sphingobacterium sp. LRF_L2]|uniref:hypothetical protein n=1 Tax=Sphingobacterium sp. LRF_L2 TaxID=3369421 RepID=UPI003F633324